MLDVNLEVADDGTLYYAIVTEDGLTLMPIFEEDSDTYADMPEEDNVVLEVDDLESEQDSSSDDDDSDLVPYLEPFYTVEDGGVIVMTY